MADDVKVMFGADISGLSNATSQVKDQFNQISSVGDRVASSFGRIGSAATLLGTGLAVIGLDAWVRGLAETGVEAERLSAALGITGKQFLDLKASAALSGVGVDALALSIERMSLQVQRSTRDAFTPQAEALKVLGLSAKDLIGLSADQYFNKIAAAASNFNPSLNLTNALMTIGGRSMANMVGAYTQGTDKINEFTRAMAATKVGQEGFFHSAADTHRQLLLMDSAVNGLNKQLFLALKPTLDIIIMRTHDFALEVRESIRDGGAWGYALKAIDVLLKSLVTSMIAIAGTFEVVLIASKTLWKGFTEDGGKAAEFFKKSMDDASARMRKSLSGVWREPTEEIATFSQRFGTFMKKDADALDELGRKRLQIAMAAIDAEIKAVEMGFERKKLLYEREVLGLTMTEGQKIQATAAAAEQRYNEEVALLKRKLQLGGLDIAQRAEIENRITELALMAKNERLKFENDYVKEVQGQWGQLFNTLQSSWSGQLRGLLQGTTTWKNAMKSIFTDLVVFAIQKFTELAIIKPLIESVSKAFAPTEIFADILKLISKMIGQVFAGATAFFAPTLGPAAPAAGAAVAAATEATALSYDTGSWSVPQTANALVHRDEMILPVDFASAVRSALTGGAMGGSSNMNVNIQAWDGASVARWLRTGGAEVMAKAVSASYSSNPTLRPRY